MKFKNLLIILLLFSCSTKEQNKNNSKVKLEKVPVFNIKEFKEISIFEKIKFNIPLNYFSFDNKNESVYNYNDKIKNEDLKITELSKNKLRKIFKASNIKYSDINFFKIVCDNNLSEITNKMKKCKVTINGFSKVNNCNSYSYKIYGFNYGFPQEKVYNVRYIELKNDIIEIITSSIKTNIDFDKKSEVINLTFH